MQVLPGLVAGWNMFNRKLFMDMSNGRLGQGVSRGLYTGRIHEMSSNSRIQLSSITDQHADSGLIGIGTTIPVPDHRSSHPDTLIRMILRNGREQNVSVELQTGNPRIQLHREHVGFIQTGSITKQLDDAFDPIRRSPFLTKQTPPIERNRSIVGAVEDAIFRD